MKEVINLLVAVFLAAVPGIAFMVMAGLAVIQNAGLYCIFVGIWIMLVTTIIFVNSIPTKRRNRHE